VIEKWGKFSGIAQPGLHCLNPFAGEWLAGRLSLRVQSLDVRCDTKTKVGCRFDMGFGLSMVGDVYCVGNLRGCVSRCSE